MSRGALVISTTGTVSGLTLVQGSNTAFAGLATGLSGAGWPSATDLGLSSLAGVFARNTTTGQWGKRDEADTTWIVVGVFSEGAKTFTPAGLASVATSGAYADLSGRPTLGTAAAANTGTSGAVVPLCSTANIFGAPQVSQAKETANKSGSVTPDFSNQNFEWTLTATMTALANPTLSTAMVGQKGTIEIIPGSYTTAPSWGSYYKRVGPNGGGLTLSSVVLPSSGRLRLDYHIVSTTRVEVAVSDVEA